MKVHLLTRVFLLSVILFPPFVALASPPSGGYCMNPSGAWIPIASLSGTAFPGTPPSTGLYGSSDGGTTWLPLQCDASGNLIATSPGWTCTGSGSSQVCTAPGTVTAGATVAQLTNGHVWNVSQFSGADFGQKLQATHDAATAGDTLDATMMRGSLAINSTVTFTKTLTVLLPDTTITNNAAVGIQLNSGGNTFIGSRGNQAVGQILSQAVAGTFIQMGTDDGNGACANEYNGPQGFVGRNLHFTTTGGTTALANGLGYYLPGTSGLVDWRGGNVELVDSSFTHFSTGFSGVQSDIDNWYATTMDFNHTGAFFGCRSDQFTAWGGWSAKNDTTLHFDSNYGATLHDWVTDGDGAGTTNCPVQIDASGARGAGNLNFDHVWFESSDGSPTVPVDAFVCAGISSAYPISNVTFDRPQLVTSVSPNLPRTIALLKHDNIFNMEINTPEAITASSNLGIDGLAMGVGSTTGASLSLDLGRQKPSAYTAPGSTNSATTLINTQFGVYAILSVNNTSPDLWSSHTYITANTAPTVVSTPVGNFAEGWQTTVVCGDTYTSFATGSTLVLTNGPFTCASLGNSITLVQMGSGIWHEISRSGDLGTPVSGVLTNATGLPLSTGVTGTLSPANGGLWTTKLASVPLVNTGGTSTSYMGTMTIPANTMGATSQLSVQVSVGACNGTTNVPTSACTSSANTGTCTLTGYFSETSGATGTTVGFTPALAQGAAKAGQISATIENTSTSTQLMHSIGTAAPGNTQSLMSHSSISTAAASYLNLFLTNSVAGDHCFIDAGSIQLIP